MSKVVLFGLYFILGIQVAAAQTRQWRVGEWVGAANHDGAGKFSHCGASTVNDTVTLTITAHASGGWFIALQSEKFLLRQSTPYALGYSVDGEKILNTLAMSPRPHSIISKLELPEVFFQSFRKGSVIAFYLDGSGYQFDLRGSAKVYANIKSCIENLLGQPIFSTGQGDARLVLAGVLPDANFGGAEIKAVPSDTGFCEGCSAIWIAEPYGGSLLLVSQGIFAGLDDISAEHVAQDAKKCPGKFGSRRSDASSETSDALILTVACEKDGVFEPSIYVFVRGKSGLFYVLSIRSIGGARNSDEKLERVGFDLMRAVLRYDANKED